VVHELISDTINEYQVPSCDKACAVEFASLTAIEMATSMDAKDITIVHSKDNSDTKDMEKFFASLVGKVEFVYVQRGFFDDSDDISAKIAKIKQVQDDTYENLAKEAYWYLTELSDEDMLKTMYLFINDYFAKEIILKLLNKKYKPEVTKPESILALNTLYTLLSPEYQDMLIRYVSPHINREELVEITIAKDTSEYLEFLKSLREVGRVFFKR
jgi:hypothetical protein